MFYQKIKACDQVATNARLTATAYPGLNVKVKVIEQYLSPAIGRCLAQLPGVKVQPGRLAIRSQ